MKAAIKYILIYAIVTVVVFPDFITFFCHQIAVIENQRVSCWKWVTQGDANGILPNFASCL